MLVSVCGRDEQKEAGCVKRKKQMGEGGRWEEKKKGWTEVGGKGCKEGGPVSPPLPNFLFGEGRIGEINPVQKNVFITCKNLTHRQKACVERV